MVLSIAGSRLIFDLVDDIFEVEYPSDVNAPILVTSERVGILLTPQLKGVNIA